MNIILSGFMGSGKTTVAKTLAKNLSMEFVDIDIVIELQSKMAVTEIFEKYGEKGFREYEKRAVMQICAKDNCVIATGGGTLLNQENTEMLKKSGTVIFLDVSVDTVIRRLEHDTSRPLLSGFSDKENAIAQLLMGRMPIYKAASDIIIDANSDNPEITAQLIMKKLNLDK